MGSSSGTTTKKGWNSDSNGWWYVKSDGTYYNGVTGLLTIPYILWQNGLSCHDAGDCAIIFRVYVFLSGKKK